MMTRPCLHNLHKSHTRKERWLSRSLCVIFAALICLTACVGCAPKESAGWEAALAEATEEIRSLQTAHESAQKEIDALKASNEAMQQAIDAIKATNENPSPETLLLIEELDTRTQAMILSLLESNKVEMKQELDAIKADYEAVKQELDAIKADYEAVKQELDALKADSEATQQTLDALKDSYESVQEELEQLKEQLQALPNTPSPEEPSENIRIYIDQGHNPTSYHNAGASSGDLYEQDLTFTIGCLLAELLEADGRFDVCLSRPTATTVLGTDNPSSLEARVQGAKDFGADYFISLHTNAFTSDTANGIEVLVAEQEGTSYDFGNALLNGLVYSTNLRNRGMKLNPDLYVLKNATMPAALLEMGFITNSSDAALLSQSPELFAQGIYEGILTYFALPPQSGNTN